MMEKENGQAVKDEELKSAAGGQAGVVWVFGCPGRSKQDCETASACHWDAGKKDCADK